MISVFAEPVESTYFSESIANSQRDLFLKLADVIVRHYSYPDTMENLLQIVDKVISSSVVVEKYFLSLIRYRSTKNSLLADLVATDLEYLFTNTRAIYDLLQAIFRDLWERKTKIKMKGSFTKTLQRSEYDLRSKYKLPDPMLRYYDSCRPFFNKILTTRNAILHFADVGKIRPREVVICLDEGFALVRSELNTLAQFLDIWREDKIKLNGLLSLLTLIAYVNKTILEDCERFSEALTRTIDPPEPITKLNLFLRSPFVHHHLMNDTYLEEPWMNGDLESRLSPTA
jgi:hypothetical protein